MIFERALLGPNPGSINGFLPVNKPVGIASSKLKCIIEADANFILRKFNLKNNVTVQIVKPLEQFADGIITFIFGTSLYLKRNFGYGEYRYRAVIELGIERRGNCIDGKVLGHKNIDHIDTDVLTETLENFSEIPLQGISSVLNNKDIIFTENPKTLIEFYDQIFRSPYFGYSKYDVPPKMQKYPFRKISRQYMCRKVELIDYSKPFATVEISCEASFDVMSFIQALVKKLDSTGSAVRLTRTQEGPMMLDDLRVSQIHEINIEHYIGLMRNSLRVYNPYLKQFADKIVTNATYRPL